MQLEINYKRKTGKHTNTWTLNNMVLNKQPIDQQRNKKGNKKIL